MRIFSIRNESLEARLVNDACLLALREALAAYESEHGTFTSEEIADLERRDRRTADGVAAGMQASS